MGNSNKGVKETTFKSSNPHLNKAKLIENSTHDRYIEAVFKAQNKEYSDWHQAFKNSGCQDSHYLLMPTKVSYNADAGLCGNTGTLTVTIPLFRINTPTSRTYSMILLRNVTARKSSSRNLSYGLLFTP